MVSNQNFDSFEELFGKKKGKLKDKLKKLGDKIKEGAKGAAMLPILAPVAALSPMMKKALKKRGEKPVKGLKNLTEQFYHEVVKKEVPKENIVEDITTIVAEVLKWLKGKADAKKAGTASPEDTELLTDADKALKAFNPDTFKDDDVTAGETTADSETEKDNKGLLILALIVVAIFIANK